MALFRRRPKASNGSLAFDTGNADDDQLLALFSEALGGLTAPREWSHYLYCSDSAGADQLAASASNEGWEVAPVAQGFGIVATRRDLPINVANLVRWRNYFETLARTVRGGDYDGWDGAHQPI